MLFRSIMDQSNIIIKTMNEELDDLINASLSLCYSINTSWTKPQRKLIHFIISKVGIVDDFVKKEIAIEYNQYESTIFSKLKISKYYNYLAVLKSIKILIIYREGE